MGASVIAVMLVVIFYHMIIRPQKVKEEERSSTVSQAVNGVPSDEEIMQNKSFQWALSYLKRDWRCMTLAGNRYHCLKEPTILFGLKDITLTKYAGEISRKNIDAYRNGTVSEEREAALEKFAKELFGEYVEEAKKIVDIDDVADDLIELEPDGEWRYGVTLRVAWPSTFDDKRTQDLFRRELEKTSIFES